MIRLSLSQVLPKEFHKLRPSHVDMIIQIRMRQAFNNHQFLGLLRLCDSIFTIYFVAAFVSVIINSDRGLII
jgi:hypothetical protein